MSKRTFENRLEALIPPGGDVWREVRVYILALIGCALLSLETLSSIYAANRSLYEYGPPYRGDGEPWGTYLSDRLMPRFSSLCGMLSVICLVMLVVCLLGVITHWRSFSRESHALYLMRRLPTKGELFRRVALLPIYGFCLAVAGFAVLYGCYYLFYLQITPAGHLPR